MSSTYNGSGTTITTSAALLDDGDEPAAILWRVPEEAIFDSLAAIATALGGTNLTWTALTTAGGTKNMAADLTLQGVGEIRIGNVLRVLSGATFLAVGPSIFNNNATFNGTAFVTSAMSVQAGAVLGVESSAFLSVDSGGSITALAGSEVRMATAGTLTINGTTGASFTGHLCMTPITTPTGWAFNLSGSTAGWDMTTASNETILFALPFKPGDVLQSVIMRLEGDAGGGGGHASIAGMNMPQIELIRKDQTTGVFTIVGTQVDGSANAAAYDAAHDVTLSLGAGHAYVANAVYYLRVTAEGGANADAGSTRLLSIRFTGLGKFYRSSVEAYQ